MRANNLTIAIPYSGCDKNCPYCVSQMTGIELPHPFLMGRNVEKVKTVARASDVTSVLLTGKGEPCMNMEQLLFYIREFGEWPVELQTNGIEIYRSEPYVEMFADAGLDVIAFSLDKLSQIRRYKKVFHRVHMFNMTVRVALNITTMIPTETTFDSILQTCIKCGVDQLLLRNVSVPTGTPTSGQTEWIRNNVQATQYIYLTEEVLKKVHDTNAPLLVRNNWGMVVWDIDGVSVTYNDYCIQDSNRGTDIRSLIFLDDGHLYTSWRSKASRLF